MTTLVTGAGLIGSLVAGRLVRDHGERPILFDIGFDPGALARRVPLESVTLVRGDVTDLADLVHTIRDHGVTRVIHTAGLLTQMVRERPHAGLRVNLGGTAEVLEAGRLTGVGRVVFCSSASVYFGAPAPVPGPLPEDLPLRIASQHPPSVYAVAKLAAEWLGSLYREHHGLEFVALRLGGVYGPSPGPPSGGPTQLLHEIVHAAHDRRPCRLRAADLDGGAIDYVYGADAAQAAVKAAFATDLQNHVFNIAEGHARTARDVVRVVGEVAGTQLDIETIPSDDAQVGYRVDSVALDLSAARDELGYDVEYPMHRAVADYLAWLR